MQPPTCRGIRIRSTHDAHRIIRAVELGILPITQRRLDSEERKALRSGDVWVWEERGSCSDNTGLGIERWTDGRTYGPSRVRDDFLFYSERDLDFNNPYNLRERESLVKQTYSVFIRKSNGNQKKWHITAYFSQKDVEELSTLDEVLPQVSNIPVPPGRYTSARSNKHKTRPDARPGSQSSRDGSDGYSPQTPSASANWPIYASYASYSLQQAPASASTPSSTPRLVTNGATTLVPLSTLQNPPLSPSHRHPEDEKVDLNGSEVYNIV